MARSSILTALAVTAVVSSASAFQLFGVSSSRHIQRAAKLGVYPQASGIVPPISLSSPVSLSDVDPAIKGAGGTQYTDSGAPTSKVPKPSGVVKPISASGQVLRNDSDPAVKGAVPGATGSSMVVSSPRSGDPKATGVVQSIFSTGSVQLSEVDPATRSSIPKV
jgi:hypothetical protein